MASYNFQFYFQSGAGTVTVNGSTPASSYEEGTSLSLAVSFTDGNTDVQWIINNTDEGTDNPLSYVMPSTDVYIRILGTGAPVVTNEFSFFWRFGNGQGFLTVNGGTPEPFYEAGTSLEIETDLVPGFTFTDFDINDGLFTGLTNPYTFTMPEQDVDITINSSGEYTPVDTTGLKYFSEFCDIMGKEIRLEIKETDYVGSATKVHCSGVRYNFGSQGSEVFETIIGSSIYFGLIGTRDQYFELLDGGYRYWKVRLLIDSVLFWEGYLSNSFLTVNEVSDELQQVQRFIAVDGLKSLDSIRAVESQFTRISSGFEMAKTISRSINQTFESLRPMNIGCSIYETRLDRNEGLFEQLLVPDNAIYEDGEVAIFTSSGNVQLNTSLKIGECLDRMLKPFMCRLFLWKNEFYIISIPEMNKDEYTLYNYDTSGVNVGSETISSGLDLSCKFTNGQRTGKPVYTEFTNILNLGVLDESASGGLIDYEFKQEDWILLGPTTSYPGIYKLTNWRYVRSIPSGQPNSYPSGASLALIQYASGGGFGEYCKIWGTSSSAGLSDTNISYIEIDTYRNGNTISVAQAVSNTISFKCEFIVEGRSSSEPLPVNQFFGLMIQIGDSYMNWDGNQTFDFQGTFNVMEFPLTNKGTWNTIDIRPLTIPEDGIVKIRLYEVINDGGTADRYTIGFRNLEVKVEENQAFTTKDIIDKFITDDTYSLVYPEIETFIGDVETDNSSSAIKLNIADWSYPHSSLWSIDGNVEIRLSQIMLQEVANIYGQPNPRIIATALRDGINPLEIVPLQNVIYDGSYWIVVSIDLDFQLDTWTIELSKLGDIPSS